MRTIATLQNSDAGSITLQRVAGTRIDVPRGEDRVRCTLGYLPQESGVYSSVSADRLLGDFAVLDGFTDAAARIRSARTPGRRGPPPQAAE
jgi:ABC-2 type transport system ATP-binding protein